jgi:hypothetical protein
MKALRIRYEQNTKSKAVDGVAVASEVEGQVT